MAEYTTKAGLEAIRRRPQQITRRDGYGYTKFATGWVVIESGKRRGASAAESRYLNREYGYTRPYGGPDHPSYRPY